MPNFAPNKDTNNAPVQGKLKRCIDDKAAGFGNCWMTNVDIRLENETSAINVCVDNRADADLQARFDAEIHFDASQELRLSLAFIQKTGAWPKFADTIVIEVLPDDSNTSVKNCVIITRLKLNRISDAPVVECREAMTVTAVATWAWELLLTIEESDRQAWASKDVSPNRTAPDGLTIENDKPLMDIDVQPLDGPFEAEFIMVTSLTAALEWATWKFDDCRPTETVVLAVFVFPEANLDVTDETLIQ
jgi:hypothetical protein